MCRYWLTTDSLFDKNNITEIKAGLDRLLKPGGPDFQSFINKGICSAYHSRLSIQDISSQSNQPIVSEDTILVYNGEILNWPKLLLDIPYELKQREIKSDVHFLELLLKNNLIKKYLPYFRGFYSFVFVNQKTNKILYCRDSLGVKPLYLGFSNTGNPIFSSLAEAITFHPNFEKRISLEGLQLYLQYGYFPGEESIFENIYQVSGGKLFEMNIDSRGRKISLSNILNFDLNTFTSVSSISQKDIRFDNNYFLDLIENSCKLRLLSDVPCALLLSGGIDSSLLAWIYSKRLNVKLPCFTMDFEGCKEESEVSIAKKTCQILNLEHHVVNFNKTKINSEIESIFKSQDQPFVDSSFIPLSILSKEISKSFKVAITADGGDEVFGGYDKYIKCQRNLRILSKFKSFHHLPYQLTRKLSFLPSSIYKSLCTLSLNIDLSKSIYYSQHILSPYSDINKLLKNSKVFPFKDINKDLNLNNLTELSKFQLLDIIFYLKNDILFKSDRASMSAGLELREPFLDQDIVNYGLSISSIDKINNQGKICLREILKGHLPHVSMGKKKGFEIPLKMLSKSDFMNDSLNSSFKNSSLLWEHLDKENIKNCLYNKSLNPYNDWQIRSLIGWFSVRGI